MEGIEASSKAGEKRQTPKKKTKPKAEPRLRDVRRRAVAIMCPKVGAIARKLAEMAEAGNCQAAKLVFEFLGIFPSGQTEEDGDDTLARYLLRQLGIPDHPSEEEITKVLNPGSEANADAVESSS